MPTDARTHCLRSNDVSDLPIFSMVPQSGNSVEAVSLDALCCPPVRAGKGGVEKA
jgi:hypothetical protein